LEAVAPPTPFDEWADTLRARGWTVHWTPLAAISQGPYRGGSVVEVDVDGDRGYVAVPPELLDQLVALIDAQGYRMLREDVAALDNPQARGVRVTRLDSVAWEQRRELVPTEELSAEAWARTVRQNGLRVEIAAAGSLSLLPLTSAWPTGQIIAATDGTHRGSAINGTKSRDKLRSYKSAWPRLSHSRALYLADSRLYAI